jgi:ABC-2 type transport system permease protein
MNGFALYARYAAASVRTQMLYPASFIMLTTGQFFINLSSFLAMWALFDRFGAVEGWRLGEVALFFGIANMSFAIAETINRGFDVFGQHFVKTGDFDRLLLRPRATALQVMGFELRLTRFGRLLHAAVVIGIALSLAPQAWRFDQVLVFIGALAGGTALFSALLILQATLSFWTVESLEVANTLTYGGVEASQYPLDIYQTWFARFLIGIVPLGCVVYYPTLYLLNRSDPLGAPGWFLPTAPLVGFVFLALALVAWRFGVRRYRSTGS